MKVAVLCEYSGIVRDRFIYYGHDAISCDILPSESSGPHLQGDLFSFNWIGYDLIIAFPPCTYLTVTGNKWFKSEYKNRFPNRIEDRKKAIDFFMKIVNLPCEKIAIENPVGIMSTIYRKPDQIIQPYFFGDEAQKTTCLWLKNLNPLFHCSEDDLFFEKTHVHKGDFVITPSGRKLPKWYSNNKSSKIRSKTFPGIADGMALQWGKNDT